VHIRDQPEILDIATFVRAWPKQEVTILDLRGDAYSRVFSMLVQIRISNHLVHDAERLGDELENAGEYLSDDHDWLYCANACLSSRAAGRHMDIEP